MPVLGKVTQADFERMFDPAAMERWGDRWLHRLRGSQTIRLDLAADMTDSILKSAPPLKVLDIGCGQSDFLNRLVSRFPQHEYHGTDISHNAINYNRHRYPHIQYQQQALPSVGYPAATFDFISALEVVYYLDEHGREQALHAMTQALKPGGHLLLSGVLDVRAGYFDEQAVVDQIRRVLRVENVAYNYAWLITRLERPLIGMLNKLLTLDQLIRCEQAEWNDWRKDRHGWKSGMARLARAGGIRQMLLLLGLGPTRMLRSILSSTCLARTCARISQWCKGPAGRTHILVLARKEAAS